MCRFNSGVRHVLKSFTLSFVLPSRIKIDFKLSSSSTDRSCSRNTGITGELSESSLLSACFIHFFANVSFPPAHSHQFYFFDYYYECWQRRVMLYRPNVHFHCEVKFDPFMLMTRGNKVYGSSLINPLPSFQLYLPAYLISSHLLLFSPRVLLIALNPRTTISVLMKLVCRFLGFTISMYEYEATIKTLWSVIKGPFISHIYPASTSGPTFTCRCIITYWPLHIPCM